MKAKDKTQQQLIKEVTQLRQRIAELERLNSELKGAEEGLREFQEELEAIFNNVRIGIAVFDKTGKILRVNKRLLEVGGYTEKEIIGKRFNLLKMFPTKSMTKMLTNFTKLMAGKKVPPFDVEVYTKGGEKRTIELHGSYLQKKGKIAGMLGVMRDVTERKRAEEALRESAEKYHLLTHTSMQGFVAFDLDGRIIDVNDEACRMSGYSKDELLKMSVTDVDALETPEETKKHIQKIVETGSDRFEFSLRRKDGRIIDAEASCTFFRQGGHILNFHRDITERKRIEKALKESEEEFRTFMETASDLMSITDKDLNFTYVNEAMARTLGYSKEEMVGMNLAQVVKKEVVQKDFKRNLEALIKKGEISFETIRVAKDGKEINGELKIVAIYDKDGAFAGTRGVFRDITERKRTEEALRESKERQDAILNAVQAGIVVIDEETHMIVDANPVAIEMIGVPKEQVVGHVCHKFICPAEEGKCPITDLKKRIDRSERVLLNAKGKNIPILKSVIPTILSRSRHLIEFFIDITERKQMEEDLRESEERFRRVVETMKVGLGAIDENGVFTYVNEYISKMLGYSTDEMIGRSTLDFYYDEESRKAQEKIFAKRKAGMRDPIPYEVTWRRKDGQKVYSILSPTPMFDADGRYTGSFAIHTDITERKRAEQALRESEERFRALYEDNPSMYFTVDAEGTVLSVNQFGAKQLGYEVKELVGKPMLNVFNEDEKEAVKQQLTRCIKHPSEVFHWEFRKVRKDGNILWVKETARAVRYAEDNLVVLIVCEDISKRRQTEEDLQESFERLSRSLESTVSALASALEMRDPYTAGHQKRVTDLACAIAEEMGLAEERVDGIRLAGLIHDIGKINIPAEILNKPGQLTEIEYSLFKNHPQVGHDVLKTVDFPWPVAQIVLQHHERMDGSGYPQGLSGEEIMLEARILAVADIVEAIASHRPYRPARGTGDALEEVLRNKGTLYDHEVVDACLRVFYEKGFTFERFLRVAKSARIH